MTAATKGSIIILGAASSAARALAAQYAQAGHPLILAARDRDELSLIASDLRLRHRAAVETLELDAQAFDSHPAFVTACINAANEKIDGIILCFGYMDTQARAQEDPRIARRTIDVNLTGAISLLELFAPHFIAAQSGFIAALSSVAGDRGRQSNYIYGASKAGLNAYLQGLRNRLHPHSVQVTTVKPGFMDTRMSYGMPGLFLVASPEKAAKDIRRCIQNRRDTAYIPWFWRYIMLIIKTIPEFQFKKMKL